MELMAKRLNELDSEQQKSEKSDENPHLRSSEEVKDYSIKATDDFIGHVEDFIFEDSIWIIRYLVVDTRNWLPGKKVLISPEWIESVDWGSEIVHIDMNKNSIKNSPEYKPSDPVNRTYESQLYDYYGRPTYWDMR